MDDFENKNNNDENIAFAEDLFKSVIPDPNEEAAKKKTSLYGQFEEEEEQKPKEEIAPVSAKPIMMDLPEAKDEKKLANKALTIIFAATMLVIIAFSGVIGFMIAKITDKTANNKKVTTLVDFQAEDIDESKVSKFQSIYNFILEYYYKTVDPNQLVEGAISGMVDAVDDPYGKYLLKEKMQDYVDLVEAKDDEGNKEATVFYGELENSIKYIKISQFAEGTAEEFKTAVEAAATEFCRGIVLDLRGNPGGYADEAASVCDIILPEGVVATAKDKDGKVCFTHTSDANEISVPVVLLVNGGTASAAELVTGAFKDFEKGEIIGTKTYGKALAQIYKQFESDGSGLVLSVYTYYTPSGVCIDGTGIEPTIVVEDDESKDGDEQLTAAINVILENNN